MATAVPQRTYRVMIVGTTGGGPADTEQQARIAAALGWQPRAVALALGKVPCRAGERLTAKEARKLESALQRAGAETQVEVEGAEHARARVEPVSLRPSEIAMAGRAQPDATPMRISAYLAAGFAVATVLLLLAR